MDYTSLFYWLMVANSAKTLFWVFGVIFIVISLIATIGYLTHTHTEGIGQTEYDKKYQALSRKWMWWSYPFMILFCLLIALIPDRRDSLLIIAGGGTLNYLSNNPKAKEVPDVVFDFITSELKSMAADNNVNLNIKDQKNKILEEAKKMTAEELLEKIKVDSTYKKILLEK